MKPSLSGWRRLLDAVPGATGDGQGKAAPSAPAGQPRAWRLLLVLGALGVLLLTFGSPQRPASDGTDSAVSVPGAEPAMGTGTSEFWHEQELARALEEMLRSVRGVGRVQVMVTVETSRERVYTGQVSRERRTAQGGPQGTGVTEDERESWQPVFVRSQGGRAEEPLVEKERAPVLKGVLVVADGGNDPRIARAITMAVQAVTGLGTHRIVVLGR